MSGLWPRLIGPSSSACVLCFHGVTTTAEPSDSVTHVPVSTFKEMVQAVRSLGEIVPLSELVSRHQENRPTGGLYAITFDDAYASLQGEVAEVLQRDRIPATVFVTTDATQYGAAFWWDRLEDTQLHVTADRWR